MRITRPSVSPLIEHVEAAEKALAQLKVELATSSEIGVYIEMSNTRYELNLLERLLPWNPLAAEKAALSLPPAGLSIASRSVVSKRGRGTRRTRSSRARKASA